MSLPGGDVAVRMTGIGRRFGSTVALDAADLVLRRGEIHAVLGANGAGKTTLMRVLAGLDRPDSGSVVIGGNVVHTFDPGHARAMGVALVQQHFTLVPTLTASANLELARPKGRLRTRRGHAQQHLTELVERYGLPVRDGVPASAMSVGEQQRLELLRALDADAKVLVLDEPTAVLTDAEADQLLGVCRQLAEDGRAVAIITHRLGEVIAGCDRVTVLRNGSVVLADHGVADHDRAGLATEMIGSEATGRFEQRLRTERAGPAATDMATDMATRIASALEVDALSSGYLRDISVRVAKGEVVGIAGIDGNGQAELEAVLAGRVAPDAGSVAVGGNPIVGGDPQARRDAGVAYIPSDRYRHGLVRPMSLSDNLELGRLPRVRASRRHRHIVAERSLDDWSVRSAGPSATAASLSGGNAQKLVLARELSGSPLVVVACYPTRGLDPSAASTVAERLVSRAERGAAVLWIGAELDELFAVSDRIIVLAGGRITGEFTAPFDRREIGYAMTGTTECASAGS
ncbi:MAG: ABC-type uncharacterized transport system ATPase subunit [Gammaproteobacteria bacterium]|jgi:ABC-type uncharacterized transport system ATPase subunit